MSSLTNLGNSIKNSISGSAPRSSEGIYKKANEKAESIAEAAASLFSSKEATAAKKSSIANTEWNLTSIGSSHDKTDGVSSNS